jgi:hypothetical protein
MFVVTIMAGCLLHLRVSRSRELRRIERVHVRVRTHEAILARLPSCSFTDGSCYG